MPNMKYKSYSYREIAEAGKSITNTRMLYMFCSFFVIFQSKRFYSTSVLKLLCKTSDNQEFKHEYISQSCCCTDTSTE